MTPMTHKVSPSLSLLVAGWRSPGAPLGVVRKKRKLGEQLLA